MSMDTRNLYDRWTKDVHAGGAYHATIYIPGYVWPTEPCFLTLGIEMAASAMSEKAPATLEAGDILQTRTAE